jgi:hypothetical protein
MCKPGEPIPASQPNKGSVKGRKEKKRIKQRKDFIMVRNCSVPCNTGLIAWLSMQRYQSLSVCRSKNLTG